MDGINFPTAAEGNRGQTEELLLAVWQYEDILFLFH